MIRYYLFCWETLMLGWDANPYMRPYFFLCCIYCMVVFLIRFHNKYLNKNMCIMYIQGVYKIWEKKKLYLQTLYTFNPNLVLWDKNKLCNLMMESALLQNIQFFSIWMFTIFWNETLFYSNFRFKVSITLPIRISFWFL